MRRRESKSTDRAEAVDAAMAVLDAYTAALNQRDEVALCATLHFPHYRLAGARVQVWETPDRYLADFLARSGKEWHHSAWDSRTVIASSPDKVHFDVQFTRYRSDGSSIGQYRSLWIVTQLDGRWAAQARSSFAG